MATKSKKAKKPTKTSDKKAVKEKSLKNLTPFQSGVSGNPSGRPKLPEDIARARQVTNQDVERSIHAMLQMTEAELSVVLGQPETKNLDRLLASILEKGMKGDIFRASFILDRAGARLPQAPIQINIQKQLENLPTQELAELGKKAIIVLEASHKSLPVGLKND